MKLGPEDAVRMMRAHDGDVSKARSDFINLVVRRPGSVFSEAQAGAMFDSEVVKIAPNEKPSAIVGCDRRSVTSPINIKAAQSAKSQRGAETRRAVVSEWNDISEGRGCDYLPPHNRASVIAKKLGISQVTVRVYLREANLKIPKKL